MYFVDDIATDYLRQNGFLGAVELRKIKNCVWYKVRKADAYFEAEVYGPAFANDEDLAKYLKSLREFKSTKFTRATIKIFSKKSYTFIIREFIESEPVYKTLMRTGGFVEESAMELLKNSTLLLDSISSLSMKNFSPLVLMMQMNSRHELILDGLRCGPWVKDFEEVNVIYEYLNPKLPWAKQINYFKNKFMLKVFIGNPYRVENINFENKKLLDYLLNIQNDPENYSEQLEGLFTSEANPFKKQDHFLLLILSISLFVSLALYKRHTDRLVTWEGETKALSMAYKEGELFIEPESRTLEPLPIESENQLGEEQKLLDLERRLYLGYFKDYKLKSASLTEGSLREESSASFAGLEDQFDVLLKKDFTELNNKVNLDLIEFDFQGARELLTTSIERYHESDKKTKLISRLYDLDKLEEKHDLQLALDRQKEEKLKQTEQELVRRAEDIVSRAIEDYINDFSIKVRQLVIVESELKTADARKLIEFYIDLIQNNQRIFSFVRESSKEEKLKLYRYVSENVEGMKTVKIVDLSNRGFEYQDTAGGSVVKFSELRANQFYGLLSVWGESQDETFWFDLHYYLVAKGWLEEVKDLVEEKPSLDFKKNEDKFIGVTEARQRLFSDD
ncbi:MAG: hypothetical protein NE334_06915 [Lentisphaeraceae bacterium]|nr:hypothetical protein [Lentisphaeraceae bacterium]